MKKIRYIIEAIFIRFIYILFRILPMKLSSWLGGRLALVIGPFLRHTRIADNNIKLAFPGFSEEKRKLVIRQMYENLGRILGEFPHISKMSDDTFNKCVTIDGLEHLKPLEQSENGGIFISAHFGNWELAPKTAYVKGYPLSLVYRKANNPFVDQLITYNRKHYQREQFPKGVSGARFILKALKEKKTIGMLVDQKMNDGIPVPFFGLDAMTAPAVANLALRFNCPVIPTKVVRKQGTHFAVTVYPEIKIDRSDNFENDVFTFMTKINGLIEEWITENPEQWLWLHKRWPKHIYN